MPGSETSVRAMPLWAKAGLLAVTYVLAAELGNALSAQTGFSTFWPPSGVLLAFLLLAPPREWPYLIAAGVFANMSSDLMHGRALLVTMGFSTGNALEAFVGAALVRRAVGRAPALGSLREVGFFVGHAALLATAVSATVGTAVVASAFGTPDLWRTWSTWWITDVVGVLVIAPVILCGAPYIIHALGLARTERVAMQRALLRALMVLAAGLVSSWLIVSVLGLEHWKFLLLPGALAAGVLLGPFGGAAAVLIVALVVDRSLVSVAPAAQLVSAATAATVLEVQAFIAIVAVTTLVVSVLIAANRRIEGEARVSAEKYRVLFEHFPVGVTITDESGHVVETSRRAATMLGVDDEEHRRRGLDAGAWRLVRRDGSPVPTQEVPAVRALEDGVVATEPVLGVEGPDGVKWLNVTAAPIPVDGYGVAVAYTDISSQVAEHDELVALRESLEEAVRDRTEELERVNAELREASAAKSRFLGNMSHELRTPLNSVIGFAGVMQQGLAGPLNDEQLRQVTMIGRAGERLLSLVNDLLDLTRIESGKVTVHLTRFRVADLLEQVIEATSPLAEEKGLDLRVACEPADVEMLSDVGKVRQVLVDLVQNAVKFTEQGGVRLECARDARMLVFRVADTGIGIPPGELANIMGEFHQIDRAADGMKPQGTGLGLAISTRLASLLGGEIAVESTVGEGSTFTLRVPAELGPAAGGARRG